MEEGRIGLHEPVTTYLPNAPVAAGATVGDLLNARAGEPNHFGQLMDITFADPSHIWTLEGITSLIDPADTAPIGEYVPSIGNEMIIMQLIEAVEGADYATALATRISGPLALETMGVFGPDLPRPDTMPSGWDGSVDIVGEPDADLPALVSLDGRVSSAADLATFLTAMFEGRLLSQDSLALIFDEDAHWFSYGFELHDSPFGDLGDMGARYYFQAFGHPLGFRAAFAGDPDSGDIIIVVVNTFDLDPVELVREIAIAWAAEKA